MPNVTGASLTPIYERLNAVAGYHPMSADTFGDWTMEAGDIVTVSSNNVNYQSPIHSLQMVWKGAPKVQITSTGKKERDPVARQSARKYGRGGAALRSQESMYSHFESEDGTLYSTIYQTASEIRTEVAYTISNMSDTIARSVITQTATYIRTEVQNAASEITESVIEQTSTYIMTTVSGIASGVAYSVVTQTMTGIEEEIVKRCRVWVQLRDPVETGAVPREGDIWIKSAKKTWNELAGQSWSEVSEGTWRGLYNAEHFVWHNNHWEKQYDEATIIEQGVEVNRTNEKFEVLARQIDSNGKSAESNLTVTAQKIYSDVSVANRELYSTIAQTATNIMSRVSSGDEALYSTIEQTSTYIMSRVVDVENGLSSEIEQTASQIRMEVSNSVSQLASSITVQANRISLVVEGTGANAHIKPASIVAAINADQTSSTIISANHVLIDGNTKINDVFSVANDYVYTKVSLYASPGNMFNGDHVGSFYYSEQEQSQSVRYGILKKAQVDGNTLKIWKFGDSESSPSITFSKAASLSGSWSGGNSFPLTVSAGLNNTYTVGFSGSYSTYDRSLELTTNGVATVSSIPYSVTVPLKIQEIMSGQQSPESRYTKNLDVSISTLLQAKSTGSNGTVTPDTGYIGLKNVTVSVSPTWGTSGFVDNTNNLPSGTKHQVNSLKTSIVSNRSRQGYIYFTIAIAGATHVYYFTDNGDGWTT